MARYSADAKEQVRDAVDMVDLVSSRTELRRAGANRFEGLCPFHDERTPSFGIDPVKKVYHCFGCGSGGDVFRFVQETEGVDFQGALELLADRYAVELEVEDEDPRTAARRRRRERLYALLERYAAYYARYLWEAAEAADARAYVAARGLDEATLRRFRVGYAASAWDHMYTRSRSAGFSDEELLAAGVVQRSRERGTLYDRFRGRLTFPLADQRGRGGGAAAAAARRGGAAGRDRPGRAGGGGGRGGDAGADRGRGAVCALPGGAGPGRRGPGERGGAHDGVRGPADAAVGHAAHARARGVAADRRQPPAPGRLADRPAGPAAGARGERTGSAGGPRPPDPGPRRRGRADVPGPVRRAPGHR